MVKTPSEPRLLPPGTDRQVWRDGNRAILSVDERWPRLTEDCPGLRRVNRYYAELARRWRSRWEQILLPAAGAAPADAPAYRAELDFQITLLRPGWLSLWWEVLETDGRSRPVRLREGDIWQLPAGVPVTLPDLVPCRRSWRSFVLEEVRRQTGERIRAGESLFRDDWVRLCARHLSPHCCWLTENGPVVFYPMCTIAPALEGFPTYLLPVPPPDGV